MASDRAMGPMGRRLLFCALYFSEGAPIGYIWWAMPTKLRDAGMPVDQVAAIVAMLALPWSFKFLWAPGVDAFRGRRWGYRCWITVAQIAMGLALLPLGFMPLDQVIDLAKWLLIAHAFAAATQDVAIDALAVSTIPHDERGRVTGWMQAGMLVGRAIFGGVALTAESWIGERAVVLVLIGCIWFSMVIVWLAPGVAPPSRVGFTRSIRRFGEALRHVLTRRATWLGVAIALTAGAGFEAVGGLVGPFLIDGGATQDQIGYFLALPVIGCMIIGALAGGWLADRIGHRMLVGVSIVAVVGCIGLIGLGGEVLGAQGLSRMAIVAPIYLFIGTLTASSYALFMDLTEPSIGGTQFSAFMGATNLCEVWAVALAGRVAAEQGYATAFGILGVASLIAIPFLALLPDRPVRSDAQAE